MEIELTGTFWLVVAVSGLGGIFTCALCESVFRARARQSYALGKKAKLPELAEIEVRERAIRPTVAIAFFWGIIAIDRFGLSHTALAAFLSFVVSAIIRSDMRDDEATEY